MNVRVSVGEGVCIGVWVVCVGSVCVVCTGDVCVVSVYRCIYLCRCMACVYECFVYVLCV